MPQPIRSSPIQKALRPSSRSATSVQRPRSTPMRSRGLRDSSARTAIGNKIARRLRARWTSRGGHRCWRRAALRPQHPAGAARPYRQHPILRAVRLPATRSSDRPQSRAYRHTLQRRRYTGDALPLARQVPHANGQAPAPIFATASPRRARSHCTTLRCSWRTALRSDPSRKPPRRPRRHPRSGTAARSNLARHRSAARPTGARCLAAQAAKAAAGARTADI